MDGIHLDSGCRYGSIRNVRGTCYDDIVALNANDCYDGPIQDIEIDGVFGANSLRGVRLLSTSSLVSGISISNIYGTFTRTISASLSSIPRQEGEATTVPFIFVIFMDVMPREFQSTAKVSTIQCRLSGSMDLWILIRW